MQHPPPGPVYTFEPVTARRTGLRFFGWAAAAALIAIASGITSIVADGVAFDAVAAVTTVVAVLCYGKGCHLYGWVGGRRDAGRLLDRVADTADLPGRDVVDAYRAAAAIAAGWQ